MEEPGFQHWNCIYDISTIPPACGQVFLIFVFWFFFSFFLVFFQFCYESKRKGKKNKIDRNIQRRRISGERSIKERYKEEEKRDTTERIGRLWYTYIHTYIYVICVYICVYTLRLPLLKVCQPIDKLRHCILRAANSFLPFCKPP